jgi:hypothetical protein
MNHNIVCSVLVESKEQSFQTLPLQSLPLQSLNFQFLPLVFLVSLIITEGQIESKNDSASDRANNVFLVLNNVRTQDEQWFPHLEVVRTKAEFIRFYTIRDVGRTKTVTREVCWCDVRKG